MNLQKAALLLIDLQKEGGTSNVAGMDQILQKTALLIKSCREMNIPIIYTRHINRGDAIGLANKEPLNAQGEPLYYHDKTDAIEVADLIKPEPHDIIIDKYRYSGFHESSLDLMLKGLGIEHLIIGGVLTDVCVISTAMDAYYRDYQVSLVEDICGTTTEGAHMAAVLMMANWIYDLQIYEAAELCKRLNKEEFRVWTSSEPDELQFTPDNMRDVFSKITAQK
ncbi:cysteine hydrolase family protein [Sporosarcina sp. G11-34]|uniref:cysteine hydrolase family protein n=1 Tax=Sporosarcina sp. G11-34 TaxID=2849605 RepID=UPI0022A9F5FE|nr:isochorismatase family cysteine hydrolase [Sporosarcina sp. G11-34]MCZ2260700.1 cysteine hydrolase [Sporosarcina sp. G11-34]